MSCRAGAAGLEDITTQADNVTLDLNGFTPVRTSGYSNGIIASAVKNISVFNGPVRGWGAAGVNLAAVATAPALPAALC